MTLNLKAAWAATWKLAVGVMVWLGLVACLAWISNLVGTIPFILGCIAILLVLMLIGLLACIWRAIYDAHCWPRKGQ